MDPHCTVSGSAAARFAPLFGSEAGTGPYLVDPALCSLYRPLPRPFLWGLAASARQSAGAGRTARPSLTTKPVGLGQSDQLDSFSNPGSCRRGAMDHV